MKLLNKPSDTKIDNATMRTSGFETECCPEELYCNNDYAFRNTLALSLLEYVNHGVDRTSPLWRAREIGLTKAFAHMLYNSEETEQRLFTWTDENNNIYANLDIEKRKHLDSQFFLDWIVNEPTAVIATAACIVKEFNNTYKQQGEMWAATGAIEDAEEIKRYTEIHDEKIEEKEVFLLGGDKKHIQLSLTWWAFEARMAEKLGIYGEESGIREEYNEAMIEQHYKTNDATIEEAYEAMAVGSIPAKPILNAKIDTEETVIETATTKATSMPKKKSVTSRAWEIARETSKKNKKSPKENFAKSMKKAWAEFRVENKKKNKKISKRAKKEKKPRHEANFDTTRNYIDMETRDKIAMLENEVEELKRLVLAQANTIRQYEKLNNI
jgi:pyruvoyl-dependent arginine decarboxylase (PvlArgDC)